MALKQKREMILRELEAQTASTLAGKAGGEPSTPTSMAELHSEQVEALLAQLSLGGTAGGALGGWSQPSYAGISISQLQRPVDTSSEASYFTSRWLLTDLT